MDALGHIRAAGGVVWRLGSQGEREVVLVHRPTYDDWTLPKGKLKPDEHPLVAAVREVTEETGIRPRAGTRLPTVHYDVWAKTALADKLVDYWAMTVLADEGFTPGAETDVLAWVSVPKARRLLTYPHDLKVLAAFAELPPLRGLVIALRPPVDEGAVLCFAPTRLVCAPGEQSLDPLARTLGLPIEADEAFAGTTDPKATARRVRELSEGSEPVVVCCPGEVIAATMATLTDGLTTSFDNASTPGWVVSFATGGLVLVDELP